MRRWMTDTQGHSMWTLTRCIHSKLFSNLTWLMGTFPPQTDPRCRTQEITFSRTWALKRKPWKNTLMPKGNAVRESKEEAHPPSSFSQINRTHAGPGWSGPLWKWYNYRAYIQTLFRMMYTHTRLRWPLRSLQPFIPINECKPQFF